MCSLLVLKSLFSNIRVAVVLGAIMLTNINVGVAQRDVKYTGIILSADMDFPIQDVKVSNVNTNYQTTSAADGTFSITYKIGDRIEFRHEQWETKLISGRDLKDTVLLHKKNILIDEVIVTRTHYHSRLNELKAIQKEQNRKEGIYYGGRPPIALLSPFGGKPITFFYELLSKGGRQARKMERTVRNEVQSSEVEMIFNPKTIREIVPIEDSEMAEFIEIYRPSWDQVRTWNSYDIQVYIKESYDEFKGSR